MTTMSFGGLAKEQRLKFEALFNHYRNLMMHIAREITRNNVLAEEAVQDALLKILLHIDDIDEVRCRRTKGWVILITKRAATDKARYESRRVHEGEDAMDMASADADSLEATAIRNLTLEIVKDSLKELSERDFEMIMLRYYCGYTDTKLAKHYSISPALVRKRCERARKRLLIEMGPRI